MTFKDKYTDPALNEAGKIKLSQDQYALCEVIDNLACVLKDLTMRMP